MLGSSPRSLRSLATTVQSAIQLVQIPFHMPIFHFTCQFFCGRMSNVLLGASYLDTFSVEILVYGGVEPYFDVTESLLTLFAYKRTSHQPSNSRTCQTCLIVGFSVTWQNHAESNHVQTLSRPVPAPGTSEARRGFDTVGR